MFHMGLAVVESEIVVSWLFTWKCLKYGHAEVVELHLLSVFTSENGAEHF